MRKSGLFLVSEHLGSQLTQSHLNLTINHIIISVVVVIQCVKGKGKESRFPPALSSCSSTSGSPPGPRASPSPAAVRGEEEGLRPV